MLIWFLCGFFISLLCNFAQKNIAVHLFKYVLNLSGIKCRKLKKNIFTWKKVNNTLLQDGQPQTSFKQLFGNVSNMLLLCFKLLCMSILLPGSRTVVYLSYVCNKSILMICSGCTSSEKLVKWIFHFSKMI